MTQQAFSSEEEYDLALLITAVQIEDLEDMALRRKGKGIGPSDSDVAQDYLIEHLREVVRSIRDHKLARSIQRAAMTDGHLIQLMTDQENEAQADHLVAQHLQQTDRLPDIRVPAAGPAPVPEVRATGTPYRAHVPVTPLHTTPAANSNPSISNCASCLEDSSRDDMYHAPCGHYYDKECLTQLIEMASRDETLFPPRCCKMHFAIPKLAPYIDEDIYRAFLLKEREFSVKNRLYCPNPRCATFLGEAPSVPTKSSGSRSKTSPVTVCGTCQTSVCLHCKSYSHAGGVVCRGDQDDASQELLKLAGQVGWKRCPTCAHLVELSMGCNHMTCRCKSEFCYKCAAKWKSCLCAHFEEDQLLQAQERVDRVFARAPVASEEVRQLRMEHAKRHVQRHHDCQHINGFKFSVGGGVCASCSNTLPAYLFDCGQCAMRVCNRCRMNRI